MQTVAQRPKALHEQRAGSNRRAEESCIDADFPLDTSSVSYYFSGARYSPRPGTLMLFLLMLRRKGES